MPAKRTQPIHPGVLLKQDLEDMNISLNLLSRSIRVPLSRLSLIANGKRAITADTALRLARFFGTAPQYWMNLQSDYDLRLMEIERGEQIAREVLPNRAA